MRTGRGARGWAVAAVAVLALGGCSDGPTDPGELAVAVIEFQRDSLDLWQDWSVVLELRLLAENGQVLEGRQVEWASSDEGVASVTASGVVEGVDPGSAEITATSEGVSESLPVEVRESPEVEITEVTPDTLRPGGVMTVRGDGFVEEGFRVRVAGLPAEVISRTSQEAQVQVPAICTPEPDPTVEVLTLLGVRADSVRHPGQATEPLALAAGEFRRLPEPSDFCLHFAPTQEDEAYLVGVQSVSALPGSLTPATVRGMVDPPVAEDPVARHDDATTREGAGGLGSLPGTSRGSGAATPPLPPDRQRVDRTWERHHRTEARIRQQDRELARRLARRAPAAREAPEEAPWVEAQGTLPPTISEGDTVEVRIPDLDEDSLCSDYQEVQVVARRVGEHAVWLADVDNPAGALGDADYDALADDFDTDIYPAVVDHFGEPTDFDGTGRIAVVISRVLNDFDAQVLGFVTSADFNPRSDDCPASDFGEYFYTRAPESGTAYGSLEEARMDLRRLAAHELTHLIQFGRRVDQGVDAFQTTWELEGQAVLAEEVAGYRSLGREPRSNLGLVEALGRDKDPETGVRWHLQGTNDLFRYFGLGGDQQGWSRVEGAPEQCTWLDRDVAGVHGAPCQMRRRDPYGVAWSFLRWVADHHHEEWPGGEAHFHSGLIDRSTTGFESVEAITGRPREELLARWAASLYADGRVPEDAEAEVTFPSWDLLDIDQALAEDETLPPEARLLPRERGFTDFVDDVAVRGASTAYFVMEGEGRARTFVQATGREDPTLPEHMQLWIVRLR